jgi:hypothetical protein
MSKKLHSKEGRAPQSFSFCRHGRAVNSRCCENQRASPPARGHTSMPVAAARRPARRRRAMGERRVASNRPNECCSCAFFWLNSRDVIWIRSMADIQLKTVRSRSQLYAPETLTYRRQAPHNSRHPSTKQERHCYEAYNEFHRCAKAKGETNPE